MFEALEQRVNRIAMVRLANATAVINGVGVRGIFSNGYMMGDAGRVGFDAREPIFTCQECEAEQVKDGDQIRVEYRNACTEYIVCNPEPDGAGMLVLGLKLA